MIHYPQNIVIDAKLPRSMRSMISITNLTDVDLDIFNMMSHTDIHLDQNQVLFLGHLPRGASKQFCVHGFVNRILAVHSGFDSALGEGYFHQFPLCAMEIVPIRSRQASFFVHDADRIAMVSSYHFLRELVAKNHSDKGRAFFKALAHPKQALAVKSYFAATLNYQACTLASMMTVLHWIRSTTPAWRGHYDLYRKTNPGSEEMPSLIGKVAIISEPIFNAAVLSMREHACDDTRLEMDDSGLKQVSQGLNEPAVSLTPVWIQPNQQLYQQTGRTEDQNVLPGLRGVINGVQVFGIFQKPSLIEKRQHAERKTSSQEQIRREHLSYMADCCERSRTILLTLFEFEYLYRKNMKGCDRVLKRLAASCQPSPSRIADALAEQFRSYDQNLRHVPPNNFAIRQPEEPEQPENVVNPEWLQQTTATVLV